MKPEKSLRQATILDAFQITITAFQEISDKIGLDWISLDQNVLGWTRLDQKHQIGLEYIRIDQNVLDWILLDQNALDWINFNYIELVIG